MCGICGIIDLKGRAIDQALLKEMNDMLFHRGPDDEGYYHDETNSPSIGMAMRRLSIIDLETGKQPIHNEDKTVWIVFNGEIYNFQELRKDLESRGHSFYTRSDTEVIVHLYEEYGIDCVSHLNGMFAISIWDTRKQQLFLARDRLGQKPLCYTSIDGKIYYASELKSFLKIQGFKKNINREAIHYYLTYQYVPSPMTIFEGVFRLEPASYMLIDARGKVAEKKYWGLDFSKKTRLTFNDSKEKIRGLLKDATKMRMISDVPLGAFLSGGHDSSIIVGLMSQMSEQPVKTFSIGFKGEESELKYARLIADKYGCDHREFVIEPDYIDVLPEIVWHYDQPYADSSALPSYYIAKVTRQHVTVALNGDGGDENYAGYLRYAALKASNWLYPFFVPVPYRFFRGMLDRVPSIESVKSRSMFRYAQRFLYAMKSPSSTRHIMWHSYFDNETKYQIYSKDMKSMFKDNDCYIYLKKLFEEAPAKNDIDRALYTDIFSYLPEDLLVKVDVATMANSLETRSPFLDHRLMEFNAALPSRWKMSFLDKKHILKKAFKDMLPDEIYGRKKQGFGIPVGSWFKNQWKDYFMEIVLSDRAIGRGYFEKEQLLNIFEEHLSGYRDHGYRLWALLMLELWHTVYIDH